MKILYTLPSIEVPHGGYRIVMEHLTRLQKLGHDVALFVERGSPYCRWYEHNIKIVKNKGIIREYDCIVIGSPHSIWIQDFIRPRQKCFLFMQMVEEKFRPGDNNWLNACRQFYLSKNPIIHGSHWGEAHCRTIGRTGPMYYIGNGVNLDHFPISSKPKDGKTILLEGPYNRNPAKDTDRLALQVALQLRSKGYRIVGYGFDDPTGELFRLDEYLVQPSLKEMNRLYEEATVLVKATKYDARALSPAEAMTKGTVTARAILAGDDDLIHGVNCLLSDYNQTGLYNCAKELLTNEPIRNRLAATCREYVQLNSWDKIIDQLNKILTA